MTEAAAAFKSLLNDHAVEDILADIPFFCVGILSFGVFTFLLLMKRSDSVLFCLHMSAAVAFISSILDLVQIVIRGVAAVNLGLNVSKVSAIIDIREIGFALSFGLRFLFFWGFVAQPTPGEVCPLGKAHHNGSWGRWGLFGIVLEIFTLTLTLVDPVLQILYRIIGTLHRLGPLYEVEASIQVVLSIIFILKLLLNCWVRMLANTDAIPTRMTLLRYSPAIAALVLSALIGIGNVLKFEFTETILGRFLQAIEMYILVVYTLTTPFYHLRGRAWPSLPGVGTVPRKGSFSQPLARPEDMTIRITSPVISSADFFSMVGRNLNSTRPSLAARASNVSRISSWLSVRRLSTRAITQVPPASSEPTVPHLWYQEPMERGVYPDDREKGSSPRDSAISLNTPKSFCQSPTSPQRASWQEPAYTLVASSTADPAQSPPPPSTAVVPQYNIQPSSPDVDPAPLLRPSDLPTLIIPPRIYPGSRQDALDTPYPPSSRSVYESQLSPDVSHPSGVDDIVRSITSDNGSLRARRSLDESSVRQMHSARSSRISELIRQQAELDKSIAMLRLFSVDDASASKSSESGDRTARTQSDLSLSNFPEPPWGRASVGSTITVLSPSVAGLNPEAVNTEGDLAIAEEPPPVILTEPPALDTAVDNYVQRDSSISPVVDESILASRSRVDSAGTQYEITSFIGGLSHGHNHEPSSFSSLSTLDAPDDGLLHPPRILRGTSGSGSTPSPLSSLAVGDPSDRPQALNEVISSQGSLPRRTFAAPGSRFSRPVGLPPRPRLVVKDELSPVVEGLPK